MENMNHHNEVISSGIVSILNRIEDFKNGNRLAFDGNKALQYIANAEMAQVNLERIRSFKELNNANPVLDYLERTLLSLNKISCSYWLKELVGEVLIWSEVAKGGSTVERVEWQSKGYNLFVHNVGSAQIYLEHHNQTIPQRFVVHKLILTHGLLGQYIRGEVALEENLPLKEILDKGYLNKKELSDVLMVLNECILSGVSRRIWEQNKAKVERIINSMVVKGQFEDERPLSSRIRALRSFSIAQGEDFTKEYAEVTTKAPVVASVLQQLNKKTLWFVESALQDFSLEEFLKIFAYVLTEAKGVRHLSFEEVMKSMYYEYKGEKKINLYKKRIIEKYLSDVTIDEVVQGNLPKNPHLNLKVKRLDNVDDTAFISLDFTPAAEKLIEFCVEAEKTDVMYEQSIIMLYDFFGLRRDAYDRFHNEEQYLSHMNGSSDFKRVMLDYIVGETVLDVGPGGGVMLDLVEETYPEKNAIGVDISQNVIEALTKKKKLEGKRWEIVKGDALNLKKYIPEGSVQTVLFSSVLHELFSYIPFGGKGKRFNQETVGAALTSAFDILPAGGRIIIRDGIMTEPKEQMRIIRFLKDDGLEFIKRFSSDFQGRNIAYQIISPNEVKMRVNDAMEALYTYTWGEESYVHEVQEQFGYFTPTEYANFIKTVLGPKAKIIENRHFLQDGYTLALADKVVFMDEKRNEVPLPDSTCLVVIEKQ